MPHSTCLTAQSQTFKFEPLATHALALDASGMLELQCRCALPLECTALLLDTLANTPLGTDADIIGTSLCISLLQQGCKLAVLSPGSLLQYTALYAGMFWKMQASAAANASAVAQLFSSPGGNPPSPATVLAAASSDDLLITGPSSTYGKCESSVNHFSCSLVQFVMPQCQHVHAMHQKHSKLRCLICLLPFIKYATLQGLGISDHT